LDELVRLKPGPFQLIRLDALGCTGRVSDPLSRCAVTESPSEKLVEGSEPSAKAVVKIAGDELVTLLREKAETTGRIQKIKRVLFGLGKLFGNSVLPESALRLLDLHQKDIKRPSLTKACREVLLQADRPLLAGEICQQVNSISAGSLENHKSPIASVTTIMRRLCSYGEARSVLTQDGQKAWESTGVGRNRSAEP
jgi:hypothetical protein